MYGNGKVEKAKTTSATGWLSGAFGWNTQPKPKTELKAVLGTHDVSASLPANLSNLPSASPEENLPNPAPMSLNQMDIQVLPPNPPRVNPNTDEGVEDDSLEDEAETAPLLSLQLPPVASKPTIQPTIPPTQQLQPQYHPNNLSFEGPLPSLPAVTHNQGETIYNQVFGKIAELHRTWTNVVAPAIALKVAIDCRLGESTVRQKKMTLDQELKALTTVLSETNALIRKNAIVLAQYDTPARSGKDIVAKVEDEVDMMKRNIVRSYFGELMVPLPSDSYENLTNHLRNVSESCFRVISSTLSGRGLVPQHSEQHTGR